jgi:molybdopterin converting factor subunit 1
MLDPMRIKVLYFGILKDLAEASEERMELPEGMTAGQALRLLRERTSNNNGLWNSIAVAVNRIYAGSETVLHEGDELALLPPVSGGSGRAVAEYVDAG